MKFALLLNSDPATWEMPPDQLEAAYKEIIAWSEKWAAAGKIIEGGAELAPPDQARTIRKGPDGTLAVTDGPYLELKEIVGGIVHLEADSMDEALAIASDGPWYPDDTCSVEVRPIIEH